MYVTQSTNTNFHLNLDGINCFNNQIFRVALNFFPKFSKYLIKNVLLAYKSLTQFDIIKCMSYHDNIKYFGVQYACTARKFIIKNLQFYKRSPPTTSCYFNKVFTKMILQSRLVWWFRTDYPCICHWWNL